MEAVYTIIKRLMKLKFYQGHIDKINNLLRIDCEEIRNLLTTLFGRIGQRITDQIRNESCFKTKYLARFRNQIVFYTFLKNPIDILAFQISEIKRIIERLRSPQGCCILLIGYDEEITNRLRERISGELASKGDHAYALPWAAAPMPKYSLLYLLSWTPVQFYRAKKTFQFIKLWLKIAFVRFKKELLIFQIARSSNVAVAFGIRNPIFRLIDMVFIINENFDSAPTNNFPKTYMINSAQEERTIVVNICNNIVHHISEIRRFRGDFKSLKFK